MTWRERYQRASFRGVEFAVRRSDAQVGRRTALHEYPQRDDPWPEDMGRAARRFTVDGVLVGVDYDQVRDRLIAALEAKGPGLLVHPFFGRRTVSLVGPVRISESPSDQGGMASFSLDFVEAVGNAQPQARADTAGALSEAATAVKSQARADFAKRFAAAGKPDFVRVSAAQGIRDAMTAVQNARRGLLADASILSEFNAELRNVTGQAGALMNTPADLAARIQDAVGGVRGVAAVPSGALASLRQLFGFRLSGGSGGAGATPSRLQDSTNRAAISSLVVASAMSEAVEVVAGLEFESYDQAVSLRDDLGDNLDALAMEADESAYLPIVALRAALVRDISARGADLARVARYTPGATLPALVLAHRLYGDAARDEALIARNPLQVRHPGFVPGGVSIEYLRDTQ